VDLLLRKIKKNKEKRREKKNKLKFNKETLCHGSNQIGYRNFHVAMTIFHMVKYSFN